MSLFIKLLKKAVLLLGLCFIGCKPESSLLSPEKKVAIEEKGGTLNTVRCRFQFVNDSIAFIQSEDKSIFSYNPVSGKVYAAFGLNDSVRKSVLKEMISCFPERHIYLNQDSINANNRDVSPELSIQGFYYQNDTLYMICGYTFIGHYGVKVEGKAVTGFIYDFYPIFVKVGKNMQLYSYHSIYHDSSDVKQINLSSDFTRLNDLYYFSNMFTFIYINPGGMQVNVYNERNSRFKPLSKGRQVLPLSEALVKRMGYTDTTVRNAGKGDQFDYRLKTVNNHVYYCNNFELDDITTNKIIFDGIKNDFKIDAYSVDERMDYFILVKDEKKNRYSLKVFDKAIEFVKEQEIPMEKGEKVIECDMNENRLVFIIEKNEKLYFKIFTVSY